MGSLENKFIGYKFKIEIPDEENFDPSSIAVDVIVTIPSGEKYSALFRGLGYLDYVFRKNRRTGECGGGKYFCTRQNPVEVEDVNEKNVKIAIDNLIMNSEIGYHFAKVD